MQKCCGKNEGDYRLFFSSYLAFLFFALKSISFCCILFFLAMITTFSVPVNAENNKKEGELFLQSDVFPLSFSDKEETGGNIFYKKGEVFIKTKVDDDWRPVIKSERLSMGDFVRTSSAVFSGVELVFDDGTLIHLFENSSIMIQRAEYNFNTGVTDFSLTLVSGDLLVAVPSLSTKKSFFEVVSEVAVIRTRGGVFFIEADDADDIDKTNVAVFKGKAHVYNRGEETVLHETPVKAFLETMVFMSLKPIPPARMRNKFNIYYRVIWGDMKKRDKKHKISQQIKKAVEKMKFFKQDVLLFDEKPSIKKVVDPFLYQRRRRR